MGKAARENIVPATEAAAIAPAPQGPYLAVALIAERVLTEKTDNAISLVRVVDKIMVDDPASIKIGEVVRFDLTLVASFRAGGFKGGFVFTLVQFGPSNEATGPGAQLGTAIIEFDGTPTGLSEIKIPATLVWYGVGQYWFELRFDGKMVARIPFAVLGPSSEAKT